MNRHPSRTLLRASLIALLIAACAARSSAGERRILAGYYPSWSEAAAALTATPPGYTHVILAFAKPDFAWNGRDWTGTGLQFTAKPAEIKAQIAALQARGTKVVLAVGGATYLNWAPLAGESGKPAKHTHALTRFIAEMGLDGLDVDYETDGTGAKQIAEYRGAIRALSNAADGRMLSLAAWSTGADCTKATDAAPCGGKTSATDGGTGRERLVFAETAVVDKITMVNVMSYDAGVESFDPVKAWSLYRALLPASIPVNIGFETSPEDWGPARLVASDPQAVCPGSQVKNDQFGNPVNKPYSVERLLKDGPLSSGVNPHDGAMLWHLLKSKNQPQCGRSVVISPRELEKTARTLLDE